MTILFRVDASIQIGSGHVMRCLTLAQALTAQGAECHFVCCHTDGDLNVLIRQQGFHLFTLAGPVADEIEDAALTLALLTQSYQLLIVDHYALARRYCSALRQRCQHVMVIDDLADRVHDCDILLDQNLLPQLEQRYMALIPPHSVKLLGPRFALLRREFYQAENNRESGHILIGFGGSDAQNLTALAIRSLQELQLKPITADIVIGANNPWRAELEQQVACLPNVRLHVQCHYMATLMHRAQLMLGAGGASHWERCICGLPGLVVTVAENQRATTAYLDQLGACVCLGLAEAMSAEFLAEQLCIYLSQPVLLDEIGQTAASIVETDAGTPLVVQHILAIIEG